MAFSNLAVSFPRFSLRRCIGKKGKNNSNLKETPTAACRQGEPHSTTLHHTAHSLAGTWDEAQSTGEFCSFNSCSPLLCHLHRAETTQKGIHPLALPWCQCALGKIGQLVVEVCWSHLQAASAARRVLHALPGTSTCLGGLQSTSGLGWGTRSPNHLKYPRATKEGPLAWTALLTLQSQTSQQLPKGLGASGF